MEVEKVLDLYNTKFKNKFGFDLRVKQAQIIAKVLNGKNSIGIFPTGFGKSVCFYLIPLLFDEIKSESNNICIVISPLKSLMLDQIAKATSLGIKAAGIMCREDMEAPTISGIKEGNYSLVYLSPEMLLDSEWNTLLLKSDIYEQRICAIVIDEFHLLETWGEKFRPTFSRLGEIRSHLTEKPFMLLTATCTNAILSSVTKKLHIDLYDVISQSPDRPNIYLNYKSESGMDPLQELSWYVEKIKEEGRDTPKAILYVRSVSMVGKMHRDIIGDLKEKAFLNNERSYNNRLIGIFHAGLSSPDQKHLLENFVKSDSVIRFVICTVAFGLGVNIPDVRIVMHWGMCESVLQYWQEVGRAGRDGKAAQAYMYATKSSIVHSNVELKTICNGIKSKNVDCFRYAVLNCMIPGVDNKNRELCELKCDVCKCSMCMCCNLCKSKCPCVKC